MEEISYSGGRQPSRKKVSKRFVIFGIFFIIILLLLGSVAYFVTNDKEISEENTTSITIPQEEEQVIEEALPTPIESQEPTPSVSKSPSPTQASKESDETSVAVQNGSGESGVAGAAADILREAGFTIASTGNADNFDYSDVTIQIKRSKRAILPSLEKALSAKYTIGETSTDLAESSNYDVLVIIGK